MIKSRIIGIRGKAMSGKSTLCNYIHGLYLQKIGLTKEFRLDDAGKLEIQLEVELKGGGITHEFKKFDIEIQPFDFRVFASIGENALWNYVRAESFARPLKDLCVNIFGLRINQVWLDDKYSLTDYYVGDLQQFVPNDLKGFGDENGQLNARELMEILGTYLIRGINPNSFVESLVRRIEANPVPLTIITDVRRSNESRRILDEGGRIIHLTRGNAVNISEVDIDEVQPTITLDNSNMTMQESCEAFCQILREWEWLDI